MYLHNDEQCSAEVILLVYMREEHPQKKAIGLVWGLTLNFMMLGRPSNKLI